ncbi:hypothetical protein Fmac_004282 [Flemingia macrophylla]|uniref:Phytosulfokine-beta n=1 Tax=Flemingia macrophylla TaxID=520843 RepID=A0ABD1N4H4_9FABA
MRLLIISAFFLFLIFTFNVICVFQGEALISEGVVASGNSSTTTDDCERSECKEENIFENEDYVYTNSLP